MKTISDPRKARQAGRTAAKSPRPPLSVSPRLSISRSSPQDAPFDPAQPQDGALIVAEVLRDQFNALQAEILQRVTQAAFDAAVASLNAAITQRPLYQWVVDAVNAGTDSAVATAVAQSSNNSNGVSTFDEPAYNYYDQNQIQRFIDKVNELINALRRA